MNTGRHEKDAAIAVPFRQHHGHGFRAHASGVPRMTGSVQWLQRALRAELFTRSTSLRESAMSDSAASSMR